jgi:hypothetical protein
MEDGEVAAAFDEVKADLIAEWERTFKPDERENLWRTVNALTLVRSKLASMMSGASEGQMAAIKRG